MSATAGNTCQMCGGNGSVRVGGRRGGDTTCTQCWGSGEVPLTPQATPAPVSEFAEYAEQLVASWPPITPQKRADFARIIGRSLTPVDFHTSREAAA